MIWKIKAKCVEIRENSTNNARASLSVHRAGGIQTAIAVTSMINDGHCNYCGDQISAGKGAKLPQ